MCLYRGSVCLCGIHIYSHAYRFFVRTLFQIDRFAQPPVCKLLDFSHMRYAERRKEKELKKKQVRVRVRARLVRHVCMYARGGMGQTQQWAVGSDRDHSLPQSCADRWLGGCSWRSDVWTK